MLTIVQVATDDQIHQTQELFVEYFDFLRTDVDKVDDLDLVPPLAGYREEIASLPGRYAPPDGRLLLARSDDGSAAGCVGFYQLAEGVCEIKRLWVRPRFRGQKIGRKLVERLVDEARVTGYTAMVLSTVDMLQEAIGLYQAVGFKVTEPFFDMPDDMLAHEVFMRLDLVKLSVDS